MRPSTAPVAETQKYGRSSIRMYLDDAPECPDSAFPDRGEDGTSEGLVPFARTVVVEGECRMISSAESCTAESTNTSAKCCNDGGTSI